MRYYTSGNWGFSIILGLEGSVFPRAFAMALPNAVFCFLYTLIVNDNVLGWDIFDIPDSWVEPREDRSKNVIGVMAAFTTVQFMVLSFRSSVAYNRWWEGGTLLQKTRGEWFNAYSSLIAFSTTKAELAERVEQYHHLLARLMSLLFCSGLQQVCPVKNKCFEIIDTRGIDPTSLDFLAESPDKVEVLLQWIQRSTVLNMEAGVLPIPPPILSRAFQEISRGIVNLQNARKIADFPFPFPYAQMSMVMLLVHYFLSPVLFSMVLRDKYMAALASFVVVFVLWCINFIALQLEFPFGERDNDLPMLQFQKDWNKSVATLLSRRAQQPPNFQFDQEYHRKIILAMSDWEPSKTANCFPSPSNGFKDRRPSRASKVSRREEPRPPDPASTTPQGQRVYHARKSDGSESTTTIASIDITHGPPIAPAKPINGNGFASALPTGASDNLDAINENPNTQRHLRLQVGVDSASSSRRKPLGDRIPALSLGGPDGSGENVREPSDILSDALQEAQATTQVTLAEQPLHMAAPPIVDPQRRNQQATSTVIGDQRNWYDGTSAATDLHAALAEKSLPQQQPRTARSQNHRSI